MLGYIKNKFAMRKFVKKWRKNNKHNETAPISFFSMDKVHVGLGTYGGVDVLNFGNTSQLYIGNYCSIAPGVKFILDADHPLEYVSTYPFRAKCISKQLKEGSSKGDIVISDDVWIGCNTLVLSGIKIGQGAVIAAGAVVSKDVPAYAIAAGVPARVIKYRFDKEICQEMEKVDFSKLDKEMIIKHEEDLYMPIHSKEQIEWLPKREMEKNI